MAENIKKEAHLANNKLRVHIKREKEDGCKLRASEERIKRRNFLEPLQCKRERRRKELLGLREINGRKIPG